MAADCYWCVDKLPAISNYIGKPNTPIGTCKKCFILTCGHHGLRDHSADEFICVDCDLRGICIKVSTVASSSTGASQTGSTTDDDDAITAAKKAVDAVVRPRGRGFEIEWRLEDSYSGINTLEDLKRKRPQYKNWLDTVNGSVVDLNNWPDKAVLDNYEQLDEDVQLLLIGAAILVQHVYKKREIPEDIPLLIQVLSEKIKTDKGGLPQSGWVKV